MVDQSRIAAIFNDFMSLYLGRSGSGIEQLCKKHDYHRMLMGLLSNLDEAAKVPVPQVMKECYEVYKRYRNLKQFLFRQQQAIRLRRMLSFIIQKLISAPRHASVNNGVPAAAIDGKTQHPTGNRPQEFSCGLP